MFLRKMLKWIVLFFHAQFFTIKLIYDQIPFTDMKKKHIWIIGIECSAFKFSLIEIYNIGRVINGPLPVYERLYGRSKRHKCLFKRQFSHQIY